MPVERQRRTSASRNLAGGRVDLSLQTRTRQYGWPSDALGRPPGRHSHWIAPTPQVLLGGLCRRMAQANVQIQAQSSDHDHRLILIADEDHHARAHAVAQAWIKGHH